MEDGIGSERSDLVRDEDGAGHTGAGSKRGEPKDTSPGANTAMSSPLVK